MPQHLAAGVLQRRQTQRNLGEIALPIRRQSHRAGAADKQLDAELGFQPADLMADRRWAQREVARGAAETQLRSRALERQQRGERRNGARGRIRRIGRMNLAHLK